MVRFLSAEWVDALDRAAPKDQPCAPELDGLVIGYEVGDEAYHLEFSSAGVRAQHGTAPNATITFRCDRATAAAIASGESSAQRAFMAGKLRIGGDASVLLRTHAAIAALPDLYAAVRPETEW